MSKVLVSESNLTNIANSIRAKNGTQNIYTPSQMSNAISNIPSGITISDCTYLFYQDARLFQLNDLLPYCVPTTAAQMFSYCSSLTNLDLRSLNTRNTTSMSSMFSSCPALTNLDLSNFNTSQVTRMGSMFSSCEALTNLDLSNFNTSQVTIMDYMFYNCKKLETLDISNFDFSNVTSYSGIFSNCGTQTTSGLTTVYVKDTTARNWILNLNSSRRPSTWSTANVIVKT